MNDPLKLAANTLNAQAPEGEQLAFINPMEEEILRDMGGSGKPAAGGVPSYKKGQVSKPPQRQYSQVVSDRSGALFRQTPNPDYKSFADSMGALGPLGLLYGGERPEPFNYSPVNNYGSSAQANRYGKAKRYSQVPSFDPNNPQEDAVKGNHELQNKAKALNEKAPDGERLAFINPFEEAVLKKMGGSGKPAAGGVPSYKKGDVSPPPPRDVGEETRDNLQAQVDLAPELFSSESQFRPQYADLERGIQLEQLGIDPSLGLLEAYRDYIVPAQGEMKRKSTAQEIDMIRDLGPELMEAQRSADPIAEALRQSIMDSASEDMAAGMGLTETEQRDLDQQILSGAADRGMEGQGSTFADMVSQRLSANRGIKQQRLQNASAAYQMGNFDPLLALTGRSANAPMMAQQGFGSAGFSLDSSPGIFNPESNYGGNLAAQNSQAQMDARTATAANQAGMTSGLLQGFGSLGGGFLAGRNNPCWVAREVYGEHNPAWLLFRKWMLNDSPSLFRKAYIKYGERFANFISDKPRLKARIRSWMDSKIGR